MVQRILLVMGTHSYKAQAFLEAATRLGLAPVVGSEREAVFVGANPQGLLTLDFARPAEAVRQACEFHARFPLAAVLACDDDGLRSAAAINEALGLPGASLASVERARDKRRMREACARAGVPTPWFEIWPVGTDPRPLSLRLRYPCVLKPPTLSASRGVLRADSPGEFVPAFERVAHVMKDAGLEGNDAEVLIEDYLPGDEVAVEGVLTRGELRVLAVFDKPDPLVGPAFEETIYVTPSRHAPERLAELALRVSEVAAAVGLDHGPVHAELRLGPAGWWPIEIAPRSIGGLCSRALRFGSGRSLEELLLRHALGESVDDWTRESLARGVMMVPVPARGILHGVRGIEQVLEAPGVDEVRITIPIGHAVVPPPEGNRYLGFLFAHGHAPEDVIASLREAHERLHFEIHTE